MSGSGFSRAPWTSLFIALFITAGYLIFFALGILLAEFFLG